MSECGYCGGTGSVVCDEEQGCTGDYECAACGGTGITGCPACGGTGRQDDEDDDW